MGLRLDQQNVAEEWPRHLGGLGLAAPHRILSWEHVGHHSSSCRSVLEGERPHEVEKGPPRVRTEPSPHGAATRVSPGEASVEPADLLRITRMLCHFKPPDARFCPVLAELALAAEPAVRTPYPRLIRASFATPCLTGPRGRLLSKAELALLTTFHSYFLCWKMFLNHALIRSSSSLRHSRLVNISHW